TPSSREERGMRGKTLWGALLAAGSILTPGVVRGQEEYAPPDTVFPLPLYSTRPEAGGFFSALRFSFYRPRNPMKDQLVAIRGFVATSDSVLNQGSTIGQFVGPGTPALNVSQIDGPNSYQPGWKFEAGWKFANGSAITFGWKQITELKTSAVATL